MVWQFAALLLAAMVLSIALSLWQHRRYIADVNGMARAYAGQDLRLVSGRGKGRLQGAVVALLLDPKTMEIKAAKAMVGATIFSRLKPAPELCGPMATVADRATNPHVKKAAESALEMLPPGLRPTPRPGNPESTGTRTRLPRPEKSI